MNPYQSAPPSSPDPESKSEGAAASGGSGEEQTSRDAELARRQIRLVIRLAILSVATTVATIAAFIVSGFEPIATAVSLALILGIGFTVSWKV